MWLIAGSRKPETNRCVLKPGLFFAVRQNKIIKMVNELSNYKIRPLFQNHRLFVSNPGKDFSNNRLSKALQFSGQLQTYTKVNKM